MGRFLTIVVVLVAIAFAINSFLVKPAKKAQEPAAESKPATAEAASAAPAAEEPATESKSDSAPKPEPATEPAPTAEVASATPAAEEPAPESKPAPPAAEATSPAASRTTEPILLGGPELLGGIPGEGDLTVAQIEAWLKDPKNHAVLQPELPLGLAAGAAAIQGIDANPLTRAKIELGRQLYFDTRLSSDNTISCASCHDPDFGFAKDTQFGVGVDGQEGNRNSPVAYNRIVSGKQFWDGRAESLEAQAVGPIANPIEMANTHEAAVKTVEGIEGYRIQFATIFPDGVNIDNIGKALATFERAIVTGPAPWDYHVQLQDFERAYSADIEDLHGLKEEDPDLYKEYMALKQASDDHPISESAARGGEIFFSDKGGCTACHVGANFSDELYHNLGVGMDAEKPDLGRFEQTKEDKDRGAFKTPTVRNVSFTAPYMHDGSQKTLEEVVDWYAKGGHPNEYLSEKIKKLDLTDQDKADLVEFMKTGLKSDFPPVERGRLPQ